MVYSTCDNAQTYFYGIVHGGGLVISNLLINRPTTDYVGLFGVLQNTSIDSLGITLSSGVGIAGRANVGGLTGSANASSISNCYVIGNISSNITGTVSNNTGGLIGQASGCTVTSCYATGNINVSITGISSHATGGLIGNAPSGTITSSYASGNITGSGGTLGGLIGQKGNLFQKKESKGNEILIFVFLKTLSGKSAIGSFIQPIAD